MSGAAWWGGGHAKLPALTAYECRACGWEGEAEERPTFCPSCASVLVFEVVDEPEWDEGEDE